MKYYFLSNTLLSIEIIIGVSFLTFFLFSGWSARLWKFLLNTFKKKWRAIIAYVLLFSLMGLILFPTNFLRTFYVEHIFGLSNISLSKWLYNYFVLEVLTGTLIACLLVPIFYWFLGKSPRGWWLYSALIACVLLVFSVILIPELFIPVSEKYGIKDQKLNQEILSLLGHAKVKDVEIFEVKYGDGDFSNAHVTGLFGKKQIGISNILLKQLKGKEILFVVAHELGHLVLNRGLINVIFGSLLLFLSFFICSKLINFLISKFSKYLQIQNIQEVSSLPLILLVFFVVIGIFYVPTTLALSRYHEYEADRFAIELTKDNSSASSALIKLHNQSPFMISNPGLIFQFFFAGHPTLDKRISFLNSYKPWERNEKLKYQKYFH